MLFVHPGRVYGSVLLRDDGVRHGAEPVSARLRPWLRQARLDEEEAPEPTGTWLEEPTSALPITLADLEVSIIAPAPFVWSLHVTRAA